MREIIAAGRAGRENWQPPPIPRRTPVVGQDWCYRCPGGPHLITEADHRPIWPLRSSVNGLPAVPVDNWPPRPCTVPDPIVPAAGEWQEAAE